MVRPFSTTSRANRRNGGVGGLLAVAALVLSGGGAGAASQGQLGAVSMGSIGISLTKPPMLLVAARAEAAVTKATAQVWSEERTVCVQGRGLAGFRVAVSGGAATAELDGIAADTGALIPVRGGEAGCDSDQESVVRLQADARSQSRVVTLVVIPE